MKNYEDNRLQNKKIVDLCRKNAREISLYENELRNIEAEENTVNFLKIQKIVKI